MYQLHKKLRIPENTYLLDLVSCSKDPTKYASSCSDNYLRIFDAQQEKFISSHFLSSNATNNNSSHHNNHPSNQIDGIPTSACSTSSSPNVWFVSKNNRTGSVYMVDTRQSQPHLVYQANAPALSIDLNADERYLVVGTELVGDDAKLIFWDPRMIGSNSSSLIAEFVEAHSDDVTQVKFHPSRPELLMSGSTDGLITLYNLINFVEDDAIHQTIKADSIHQLGYFGPMNEYIYAQTHTETFGLYKFEDGDPIKNFGHIRSLYPQHMDYLIDCQYLSDTQQLLLYTAHREEGRVDVWDVQLDGMHLKGSLNHGHSDTVRGCLLNNHYQKMISVGEDGMLCIWQHSSNYQDSSISTKEE